MNLHRAGLAAIDESLMPKSEIEKNLTEIEEQTDQYENLITVLESKVHSVLERSLQAAQDEDPSTLGARTSILGSKLCGLAEKLKKQNEAMEKILMKIVL